MCNATSPALSCRLGMSELMASICALSSSISGVYNLNAIPVALAPMAAGNFTSPYVPYPQFPAGVMWNASLTTETYNALQIQAHRRLSHGLTFSAAYTHNRQIQLVMAVVVPITATRLATAHLTAVP